MKTLQVLKIFGRLYLSKAAFDTGTSLWRVRDSAASGILFKLHQASQPQWRLIKLNTDFIASVDYSRHLHDTDQTAAKLRRPREGTTR